MDELTGVSEDFLCNGFYQLYADYNDEDVTYMDHQHIFANDLTTAGIPKLDGITSHYDAYDRCASYGSDDAFDLVYDGSQWSGGGFSCIDEHSAFRAIGEVMVNDDGVPSSGWQPSEELKRPLDINCTTDDWALNIENMLLELDCRSVWPTASVLPDKTFYCNESCNVFLRESSDSLKSTLHTLDTVVDVPTPAYSDSEITSTTSETNGTTDQPTVNDDNPTDRTNYMCTYMNCAKVYAKPAHLKAHLRRHIGDKPYVCTWPACTWKFSRSDELSRHRRSHSGVKPYKCDYCPKCFSRSDHLTKHRKVHERKLAKLRSNWPTTTGTSMQRLPQMKPGRRPKFAEHNRPHS